MFTPLYYNENTLSTSFERVKALLLKLWEQWDGHEKMHIHEIESMI